MVVWRLAVLLVAGVVAAFAIAGCGGPKRTSSYFTTQPGTVTSVDTRLVASQSQRVRVVAHSYIRKHFRCSRARPCRLSIKGLGADAFEAVIQRRGYRDYCYRVRFFYAQHHFAGPMQPINCT
jgi:hypothetical protein